MAGSVAALGGARADGVVTVSETRPRAMVSLKGDLGADALRQSVKSATGIDVPPALEGAEAGEAGVLWMAPDELLLLGPRDEAGRIVAELESALAGSHFLAADISDARSVFRLEAEDGAIRDVLSKLTPADLSPDAFPVGRFRRTRIAQIAGALWMREPQVAEVFVFRSMAQYAFDLLSNAAEPGGKVGHF
ncbi:MAG: sarcosine oxidase subunit gamma family protein [Pseudomonadota bacterium]